jgi:hypothetical protein
MADFASVSIGDKLNVLGIFDAVFAPTFPIRLVQMVFVLRFLFEFEDGGKEQDVTIRLEDEDGTPIIEGIGKVAVDRVPPGASQSKNVILQLQNVAFAAPGNYRWLVRYGQEVVRIPFQAIQRG